MFCLLVFLSVVPKLEVTKHKSNAKHATFEMLDTASEVTHTEWLRFNVSRVISVNVSDKVSCLPPYSYSKLIVQDVTH